MKPNFQTQWLALPPKETHQVLEKIALLTQDPTPDAKVKKKLKYMDGKLHRLRSGSFRIFYTFEPPYISRLCQNPGHSNAKRVFKATRITSKFSIMRLSILIDKFRCVPDGIVKLNFLIRQIEE